MNSSSEFEIFLVATPGLEAASLAEVRSRRFKAIKPVAGGVAVRGTGPPEHGLARISVCLDL